MSNDISIISEMATDINNDELSCGGWKFIIINEKKESQQLKKVLLSNILIEAIMILTDNMPDDWLPDVNITMTWPISQLWC